MRNTKEKILSILMLLALMANNLLYPINYVTAQDSGDVEIIGTSIEGENLDVELDVPVSDDILELENPDNVLEENGNDVILSGNNEELTGSDIVLSGNIEELTGNATVLSGDNEELTGSDTVLSGDNEELTGSDIVLSGNIEELTGNNVVLNGNNEELTGNDSVLSGNIEESIGGDETGKILDELERIRETLNDTEISGQKTHKNVTVNVKASAGTFPEGVELRIFPIMTNDEIMEIKEQIIDSQDNIEEEPELVAFDIAFVYTLSDGTEVELQPKDGESVQVTFDYSNNKTFKKAETDDNQTIEVYHINDKDENGEKVDKGEEIVEKIEINNEESKKIENGLVIDAEKFSVYVLTLTEGGTPTSFEITLDSNGGYFVEAGNINVSDGIGTIQSVDGNVVLPFATKYIHGLLGWYLSGDEENLIPAGSEYEVTENVTLYAKWEQCAEGYSINANWQCECIEGTLLPNGKCDIGLINLSVFGYTGYLMEKNLGATEVFNGIFSTGANGSNKASFGKYYQWGNNYGFDSYLDNPNNSLGNTTGNQIPVSSGYSWYNPYFSGVFSLNAGNDRTNWMKSPPNYNLWGGNSVSVEEKQGPCPVGYHVPSSQERGDILTTWRGWSDRTQIFEKESNNFAYDLKLPFAGYRARGDSKISNKDIFVVGRYYSSTPVGATNYVYALKMEENNRTLPPEIANEKPANAFSVRCLKNRVDGIKTVIFDSNRGTLIDNQQVIEGNKVVRPEDPQLPGYEFLGWYKDVQFSELWDFETDEVTENITLYAKWNYIQNFDDLNLVFLSNEGDPKYTTIMDRNLGATEIFNGQFGLSNVNMGSFGYHYQWGNNYGFEPCNSLGCTDISNSSGYLSGLVSRSIWAVHIPSKYARNTWSTLQNWMDGATKNDSIWGGAGDTVSENGNGGVSDRQGPCPDGYYVPSVYEWSTLNSGWSNSVNKGKDTGFILDLLLPPAGVRNYATGEIAEIGDRGVYWSSSPSLSDVKQAYLLNYRNTDGNVTIISMSRSAGRSIRCVKSVLKNDTTAMKVHANGGKAVIIYTGNVENGKFIKLDNLSLSVNNATFEGWYSNQDFATGSEVTLESQIPSDLYAKITCNESGYVWNGHECSGLVRLNFDSMGGSDVTGQVVTYGTTGIKPDDPEKVGYVFNGWYLSGASEEFDFTTPIIKETTLYAHWNTGTYTITWNNSDGNPLEVDTGVLGGTIPSYDGETPISGGNAQFSYEFSGWTPTPVKVVGDAIYTAVYTQSVNEYTITWIDGNGDLLKTDTFAYGVMPSYSGATPTKTDTVQTGYSFANTWTPNLSEVTGDITYIANFLGTPKIYEIVFELDPEGSGTTISAPYGSSIELVGTTVYVGGEPVITISGTTGDAEFTYNFSGWNNTCGDSLIKPCTIVAEHTVVRNEYNITWKYETATGEQIEVKPYEYGSMPSRSGNNYSTVQTGYTFSGWIPNLSEVTGDATYIATYTQTLRKYNLTVTSADITRGTVSPTSGLYDYGSTVTLTAIVNTGYALSRWLIVNSGVETELSTQSPYNITITGNTEIKAEFGYGQTTYKVKHYKQTVDGHNYESPEIEILTGITNNTTTATAKSYTGFRDPGNIEQKTILADGSTEVEIYYYRDSYNVYWNYMVDGSEGSQEGQSMTSEENYLYGQIPEYKNISGYKTVSKVYTFNGWYDGGYHTYFVGENLPEVTGQVTYTAQYSDVRREYTGIFYNENGEIPLYTGHQSYGETWWYGGEIPTKESTIQYSYNFYGRKDGPYFYSSGNLPTVTSDQNFTAVFDEVVNEYLITFVDERGNELWRNYFPYGQSPVYEGELPTKEQTISTVYTFNGWRKGDSEFYSGVGLPIVDGTGTYTVIFSETPRQYEISFVDRDGTSLLDPIFYNYGSGVDEIYVPNHPERTDTDEYSYTFMGWDPELTGTVVGDQVYTAVYTEVKRKYEVTFTVSPTGYGILNPLQIIAEYGSPITTSGNELTVGTGTVTATPATGDAQYTYNFIGWTGDCEDILTHQCTITALFDRIVNKYTITWSYRDLQGNETGDFVELPYGIVPSHVNPGNYVENNRNYIFSGWRPEPVTVTESTGYTAEYRAGDCVANYHLSGNSCTSNSGTAQCSTGTTPMNATPTIINVPITWNGSGWTEPGACEWNCNATYHQVGETCVSNDDVVVPCDTTTKPENIVVTADTFVQRWTGTGFLPETKEWIYNGEECGFTCDTNYHRNGSICASNSGVLPCDEAGTPENATAIVTGVNVSRDPTLNNGSGGWTELAACLWSCNATYHKVGDTCVSNNDLVVNCDSATRPENTVITIGTFVQRWNGIIFLPETKEWTYNGDECGFVCGTNYTRNGTSCVSNSGSDGQQNENGQSTSSSSDPLKKDYCPNGDYSDSYYDGDCGISKEDSNENGGTHSSAGNIEIFDNEVKIAYDWLYSNKIIDKYVSLQDAENVLTRGYMAKLIVKFVVKLKLIRPNVVPIECVSWNDDESLRESEEIKNYATLSCIFGVMGINMPNNEFRPNDVVSRAEFGTIISRILWGTKYDVVGDDKIFYYKKHLDALKQNNIMRDIENPLNRKELIKWVWVVLKRISDKK